METSHSVDVRMDSVKVRNETLSSSYDDTSDTESQTSDTYGSTLDDSFETQQGIVILEVDEGQPCLACEEKCVGYTPHAWRNVCQDCKCLREVHDIYHEDFVNIRERLGWEEPNEIELQCDKEKTLKSGYTWIPPGLTEDMIEEYMEQLDNTKIPKIGSQGEKYRDIQIVVQLPKQDLAQEFCRHLKTSDQKKAFEEFRHVRDATAMEIGIVRELTEDTVSFSGS